MKQGRVIRYISISLLVLLVILDRTAWASISNWQEDHSATMWVGYTHSFFNMPVGLISSQEVPNPNGMFLIGYFLSRLPGLFSTSLFLGIVQSILIVWLCRSLFRQRKLFLLTTALLLTSAVMRSIAIEFRNQWFMVLPDIFFFILLIDYTKNPRVIKIPLIVLMIVIPASLYLAGIVNSFGFFLIAALIIIKRRVPERKRNILVAFLTTALIITGSILITWLPYIKAVDISQFFVSRSDLINSTQDKFLYSAATFFTFPFWSSCYWAMRVIRSIWFFDLEVHPPFFSSLFIAHDFVIMFQALICYFSIALAMIKNGGIRKNMNTLFREDCQKTGIYTLILLLFLLVCFMLAPLLIETVWALGHRADQTAQFFPFFLLIWFTAPFTLKLPVNFIKLVEPLTYVTSSLFILINLMIGVTTITSIQTGYKKDVASPIEIPLTQQHQALNFILSDWKSVSSKNEIPIYYDFENGFYPWILEFGPYLDRWYPAPYTYGRAMDYELMRVYGFRNLEEGYPSRLRSREKARYVVSYSFIPSSCGSRRIIKEAAFLRVRIYVCEN